MRIGKRYTIEATPIMDVEPGARITWILNRSLNTYEFALPGALLEATTVRPDGEVDFRLRWPVSNHYEVIVACPGVDIDVRYDNGNIVRRVHAWAWHYISAFISGLAAVFIRAARGVVKFFKSVPERMGWL